MDRTVLRRRVWRAPRLLLWNYTDLRGLDVLEGEMNQTVENWEMLRQYTPVDADLSHLYV